MIPGAHAYEAARVAADTRAKLMLVPEDLAVERVRLRVMADGHDVPEVKIRERHRRLWGLVARGIAESDSALVYDNSRGIGPRIVATMTAGQIIGSPAWPAWTPGPLRQLWSAATH